MIKVDILVVDYPSAYNVILGRLMLNKISAVISTACLMMKFFADNEEITVVKSDQVATRRCYNASLEIYEGEGRKKKLSSTS